MSSALLWILNPLLPFTFWLHDTLCAFIVQHIKGIKRTLLIVAHLCLFGFFFPELRLNFGSWASNLLIFLLFISPLSKIFRMRLLLLLIGLRREMGILMAYLATVHGLGYLMDPDWATFILWEPLRTGDWNIGSGYILGAVAYILTLPLLLTSNDLAKKYLGGKRWKNLHTIVYVMFIFAIFHRFLVGIGRGELEVMAYIKIALVLGLYALLKALAWKNFIAPLREVSLAIAERYKASKVPPVVSTP